MRRHVGQAVRGVVRTTHLFARLVLAVALVAIIAVSALAWRLSRGPLDLPWLVHRIEAALDAGPGAPRWTVGNAALAWEGFSAGMDRPLDIRIDDLLVTGPDGSVRARVPAAHVSLSMLQLLRLRLVPRAVELEGPRLRVLRAADGSIHADLGTEAGDLLADLPPVSAVLDMLARPPESNSRGGEALLSQLGHIQVRNAALVVIDRVANATWTADGLDLDLRRQARGGADGTLGFEVGLGSQRARLDATVALRDQADKLAVHANLSELNPGRLARDIPALAALAPLDAPLALGLDATFGRDLGLRRGAVTATLGRGRVALAKGYLPLDGGGVTLTGGPADITIAGLRVDTSAPGAEPVHLDGAGGITRDASGYDAKLHVSIPRVGFAGLTALWPDGLGGFGTKEWITSNITQGEATDLRLDLHVQAPPDRSDLTLAGLSGGFDADGLTVHWLRPIPPIEQGRARVTFVTPDMLDVALLSGRQGGLQVTGGLARFTGLSMRDQFLDITADLAGPLADTLAILRNPRLHLFDKHPTEMRDPAGQVQAHVAITALPLERWIGMDDVRLAATAHMSGVHLGAIAAGHDLDQGTLDLQASNDGLKLAGTARLAGVPGKLQVDMDFRDGPPSQIFESVSLAAAPTPAQLAAIGLDATAYLDGAPPATLVWRTRRDGKGDLAVTADLTAATLRLADLAYTKPAGRAARLEAHAELDHEHVTALDSVVLRGDGLDAEARVDFAKGAPSHARLARLVLGDATNLQGDIRFPAADGAPWQITLSGASLDATARFAHADPARPKPPDTRGPPYVADARLGRVVLGPGRVLSDVEFRADNDGWINRSLHLAGRAGKPFAIDVAATLGGRTLGGSAADAGALLHALDIVADMQGGTMKLSGRYDDAKPGHPLTGTAEITDFRMSRAPALAKLLQAMTLYGLVELVRGPGLGFTRLEAPFRLADDRLDLIDARAFNTSLGMTAKGSIDLYRQRCDVSGTIVPAYFFNSLLGNIPLVGRLFSAERGGGLLAANYTLRGDCNDPDVAVNPLAALTPGFLRGLFGIFEGTPGETTKQPPGQSLRP